MMWKVGYEWLWEREGRQVETVFMLKWEREGGQVETVFMLKSHVFWML